MLQIDNMERDEKKSAKPEIDWIIHTRDVCPVDDRQRVDGWLSDGKIIHDTLAIAFPWSRDHIGRHVVAFRVVVNK